MQKRIFLQAVMLFLSLAVAIMFIDTHAAHAQTTSTSSDAALRATIQGEILSDPRAQNLSQAQLSAMVDALTAQAQAQGITPDQLTYRPALTQSAPAAPAPCTDLTCMLMNAFGLDGSVPLIPIALFVIGALFILIYGIMRELGHPHTRPPTKTAI